MVVDRAPLRNGIRSGNLNTSSEWRIYYSLNLLFFQQKFSANILGCVATTLSKVHSRGNILLLLYMLQFTKTYYKLQKP